MYQRFVVQSRLLVTIDNLYVLIRVHNTVLEINQLHVGIRVQDIPTGS